MWRLQGLDNNNPDKVNLIIPYLVLTQPIAGGPEAVGFARVSLKPWRAKG
jgi:hypothetical protein